MSDQTCKLTHVLGDYVELQCADKPLFRYNYAPTFDPYESRKPYMHPMCSLAGDEITCYRPHDHVWHKGMQMTMAQLSGENFWGGPTYMRDHGYQKLDNIGQMRHVSWNELTCDGEHVVLSHRLKWINHAGEEWIDECREIRLAELRVAEGYWSLDWRMSLRNVRSQPLRFGSPTTEGRVNAGYGGLFWRGPRSFLKGTILAADNQEGPEVMGKSSPWISLCGAHDGSANKSTMIFIDRPGNVSYPNKWFVRNDPFACIAASFSFDKEVELAPNNQLTLNYRTLIANGQWDRARTEHYIAQLPR